MVPDQTAVEDPGYEVVEQSEPPARMAVAKPVAKPVAKQATVASVDDDDEDDDDDREERRRKRKPRRKSRSNDDGGAFSFEKKILNGGVLIGLLSMIGAIVWFVLGLMGNRIFFYPPILFVIGLISFIKGLVSSNSD
ncbi:MAG: hypothetical protein U0798_13740 [Gemmataceae bacterium]